MLFKSGERKFMHGVKVQKTNPNTADVFSDLGGQGYLSEGCEEFDPICTLWLNLPRLS